MAMIYGVKIAGCLPSFYNDRAEALEHFIYCARYFSSAEFIEITFDDFIKTYA